MPEGQPSDAVLDDDHGAVNDDAEIKGTQAQQVAADAPLDHAGYGEQHRQRNHACGNQRRTDVAKEEKEHHDHQQGTEREVVAHGGDRVVHQRRSVVNRLGPDAVGQRGVDLGHPFGHTLRDDAAVFAHQHEGRAEHDFAAILGGRAGPEFLAEDDLPDVREIHGSALTCADNELAEVVERGHLAWGAHKVLLAAAFDVTRTDIAVVGRQRGEHVAERQSIRHQLRGIGCDVKLARVPANAVDVSDARHRTQLRPHNPVLDRAQVHALLNRITVNRRIVFDGPQEDFAQARRDGPQGRDDARRQHGGGLLHPFVDQLPREVDVGAVFKDHRHLREPVT